MRLSSNTYTDEEPHRVRKFHDKLGQSLIIGSGPTMHGEYIEQRNGGYYVAGTRISLDSVVYAFNLGSSPEGILEQFPLLNKLSRIYGAIAFYLDNKAEIDKYLEESEREFAASGIPLEQANPALREKIQRAKAQMDKSRV